MPGIVALVSAISADVVAALAAANLPPLVDGKILLGRQHAHEQGAPPRIVFIPLGTRWNPKAIYNRSQITGFPSAEIAAQNQSRSLHTDAVRFEIHVWGQAASPDPDGDFDATQLLYQQVVRSVHLLTVGSYELGDGEWVDQAAGATQLVKAGHLYVFSLTFLTPLLDKTLPYAPVDVAAQPTTKLDPNDGSLLEVGCSA